MTKPRVLLTVVCDDLKAHKLATVTGDPSGPMLTIEHVAKGVMPAPGDKVRMEQGPTMGPVPLGNASTEATCACGREFFLDPGAMRRAMNEGRRRVVLHPIT